MKAGPWLAVVADTRRAHRAHYLKRGRRWSLCFKVPASELETKQLSIPETNPGPPPLEPSCTRCLLRGISLRRKLEGRGRELRAELDAIEAAITHLPGDAS